MGGAIVLGLSQAALTLAVQPPLSAWVALPVWIVTAFGMGLGTSSQNVLLLRLSGSGEEGRNSAALQLSDACGGALGIGLTGAAFAAWHHPRGDDARLFTIMFLVSALVAILGSLIALRVRPPVGVETTAGLSTT
jgi:sugar phosphate permease